LFQGKLTGKILHFANCYKLNLETETAQYFLDVTGAKAISGYNTSSNLLSTLLDFYYLSIYNECNDIFELIKILEKKYTSLYINSNFIIYY